MKKNKFLLAFLLLFICSFCLSSTEASAKVKLNKSILTLVEGQKYTLKLTGTKKKITWKSNKKSIATVTSKGRVTAKAPGQATISAKVGKTTKTCKVTVTTDYAKYYEYQVKYDKMELDFPFANVPEPTKALMDHLETLLNE